MEVKAIQRRLFSSEESTHEWVIEHCPYISLKLKRERVFWSHPISRIWYLVIVFMAK